MNNEEIANRLKKYNFKVIEILDSYGDLEGPFVKYEYGRGSKKVYGLSHMSVIEKIIKLKDMEAEEQLALERVKRLKNSESSATNKLKEAEEDLKKIRKKIRMLRIKKR